jgi:redox-sensitive bicupin YhaK (pirin superfamily)
MIDVVPFASLGRFDNEWLSARYHFSFANCRDPSRMGLGPLVVWNHDTIRAGSGFPIMGAGKGALAINRDAALLAATLRPGASARHRFGTGRQGYPVVARGSLSAKGVPVGEGDGAVVRDERELRLCAGKEVELPLVDLPAGAGDAAH